MYRLWNLDEIALCVTDHDERIVPDLSERKASGRLALPQQMVPTIDRDQITVGSFLTDTARTGEFGGRTFVLRFRPYGRSCRNGPRDGRSRRNRTQERIGIVESQRIDVRTGIVPGNGHGSRIGSRRFRPGEKELSCHDAPDTERYDE